VSEITEMADALNRTAKALEENTQAALDIAAMNRAGIEARIEADLAAAEFYQLQIAQLRRNERAAVEGAEASTLIVEALRKAWTP
jgi:phage-related minor tail protein